MILALDAVGVDPDQWHQANPQRPAFPFANGTDARKAPLVRTRRNRQLRKFRSGLDEMVEAVQITGRAFDAPLPYYEHVVGVVYDPLRRAVLIRTLQGTKTGLIGDWIIRAANGQLDVCRADEFAKKYALWEASVLPFGKPPRAK
ncbi:MAG: hypothetical protein JOY61_02015 [Chloroflexi bacterium]|nr:hypothetical protein [Chloroflexota bacterium]